MYILIECVKCHNIRPTFTINESLLHPGLKYFLNQYLLYKCYLFLLCKLILPNKLIHYFCIYSFLITYVIENEQCHNVTVTHIIKFPTCYCVFSPRSYLVNFCLYNCFYL